MPRSFRGRDGNLERKDLDREGGTLGGKGLLPGREMRGLPHESQVGPAAGLVGGNE